MTTQMIGRYQILAELGRGVELWLSSDGSCLFTACGTVFKVTKSEADDLTYAGELAGVGGLAAACRAAAGQVLAIPGPVGDPAAESGCASCRRSPPRTARFCSTATATWRPSERSSCPTLWPTARAARLWGTTSSSSCAAGPPGTPTIT
ncbi:MAG: hypothetical protein HGA45_43000 [Chloroflexales bacterium]|nr:hypothetical protein [Chloroflexales bacterium]